MASLPAHATQDDMEEELAFQEVLIESLDQGADDYVDRLAELEIKKRELEVRLEALQQSQSQSPATPSTHAVMDGYGSQGSIPYRPVSNHGYNAFSPQAGPSSMQQNGMKRPFPYAVNLDSQHPSKRPTPEPSNAGTPTSSVDSFEWIDNPNSNMNANVNERARQRHLQAEAALRRQREAQSADELFARQLSQAQQRPQASSSFSGGSSFQTTLNGNGSYQRPPPQIKPEQSFIPPQQLFKHFNQALQTVQAARTTPNQMRQPQTPYIKSESGPARQQQSMQRPRNGPTEVVDLTASDSDGDDEDITEIAPAGFTPYHRSMMPSYPNGPAIQPPQYGQQIRQPMPGSFPAADAYSNQYVYGNASNNVPQQNDWMQNSVVANAVNGVRQIANTFGNSFSELNNLVNGHGHAHPQAAGLSDDEDVVYGGSRQLNPVRPPRPDMDLYRRRYNEIAHNDPAKTAEEINTLLENIRPDEELPAHLRVQTPRELSIQLHKYQELGLTWLQKCEDGSNKGGILADEMGLGKTIQMLSLLVTRKSEDPRCKTTLIIAPVALMRQWQQEIEQKVKPGHKLSVWIQHGPSRKTSFQQLQHWDVVLTTFGMLASELKRQEQFAVRKKHNPGARPTSKEQCALIGDDARWYRVVLDEAQCIKNRTTKAAKAANLLTAKYHFCMTGTPMMNNIEELYSLIHFLRISPYCRWEKYRFDFVTPLKGTKEALRDGAMRKLQTLCKAIMLRRTKKSTFEGRPILVLPERTTDVENPVFSQGQRDFYEHIERKSRLQFNEYLREGEIGSEYSAILVLLLRLRQAACHPHLIKDFGIAAAADITEEDVLRFAKELSEPVVERIKATGGNFECPVCYDAVPNPAIFIPCGHDTCRECFSRIVDPSNALRDGNEGGGATSAKCPNCRAAIDPRHVTDFDTFKKVHMRELLTDEELEELEKLEGGNSNDSDDEDDSDSDEEDDDDDDQDEGEEDEVDERGNIKDFIVDDDVEDYDTEPGSDPVNGTKDEAEQDGIAGPSNSTPMSTSKQKAKDAGKGKGKKQSKKAKGKKPKKKGPVTLADLKKLSQRNAKERKSYMRRLRKNYRSSAKIDKTMELLRQIMQDPQGEKILIFSQWTSLLDLLEIPVDGEGWLYRRYDGSMNTKERADAVDDFRDQSKNVRIMLVSLKAGNAGLNLNMANQVIILDPFWNPYIEEQAIDRAHRIGQTRPVKVHRILVQNTVEDKIIELQEKKRALIGEALDEKAGQNIARLGVQELAYLFGVTRRPTERVQYIPANRR